MSYRILSQLVALEGQLVNGCVWKHLKISRYLAPSPGDVWQQTVHWETSAVNERGDQNMLRQKKFV